MLNKRSTACCFARQFVNLSVSWRWTPSLGLTSGDRRTSWWRSTPASSALPDMTCRHLSARTARTTGPASCYPWEGCCSRPCLDGGCTGWCCRSRRFRWVRWRRVPPWSTDWAAGGRAAAGAVCRGGPSAPGRRSGRSTAARVASSPETSPSVFSYAKTTSLTIVIFIDSHVM